MKVSVVLAVGGVVLIGLLCAAAFRSGSQQGERLFFTYFDPVPTRGYVLNRALAPATAPKVSLSDEESLFQQAVLYHQTGRFEFCLTSVRAWMDGGYFRDGERMYTLAATAALATNREFEAEYFLDQLALATAEDDGDYHWYAALLALKNERYAAASQHLQRLRPDYRPAQVPRLRASLERLHEG